MSNRLSAIAVLFAGTLIGSIAFPQLGAARQFNPVNMSSLYPQQASPYGIPACLYCPQPKYTRKTADAKLKGPVVLNAVVTSDGRATNIRITKSLGHRLDKKAIETVKSWHFRPALGPDGKLANVRQMIEITFPSEPPVTKK